MFRVRSCTNGSPKNETRERREIYLVNNLFLIDVKWVNLEIEGLSGKSK